MSGGVTASGFGLAFERHRWGGLLLHALVPLAFTVFIFVAGSAPPGPDSLQVNDKVAHAAVFFALTCCIGPLAGHWLLHFAASQRPAGAIVGAVAYALSVGAGLEFWQSTIPYRTADVWDWVADAVGAAGAAVLLGVSLPPYLQWRRSPRA